MFFRALIAIYAVMLVNVLLLIQAEAQSVRDRLAKDVVVATVDGEQILSSDLVRAFQKLPNKYRRRGLRSVYNVLLEELIEKKLLATHGRLNNLAHDPEVKARVADAEDKIIANVYINRLIQQGITEEKVNARYKEISIKTPATEEVRARHILLSTEAEATEILRLVLKGGQSFEEIAKTHSKGPAAARGGDLGYFRQGDMVKPFSNTAFRMKPGEISETPVKTEFGWHIIKVEDRRNSVVPPLAKLRPQIIRDVGRLIAIEMLNTARAGAKIQRFSLEGQPLPAPGLAIKKR